MKRDWTTEKPIDRWTFPLLETVLLDSKTAQTSLGFTLPTKPVLNLTNSIYSSRADGAAGGRVGLGPLQAGLVQVNNGRQRGGGRDLQRKLQPDDRSRASAAGGAGNLARATTS